ncbi:MAG: AAA family ATPase [Alphaproteobacteria bacterium]|nr:AAA family ATPase [Alphaproteobacteria bacterium]MBU1513619.1 AAA family ATPase [Alphaproteobacteria bacterium]MBU2094736.1 AAA family ATPase [Alphaproteobacteria bacterium]MBU2150195.1 AAA family ATPase [Alphaproteobacteria bacterium]MBU2309276.1 AAA family ATPase [Alphaproteobacteria bacterium]
MTHDFGAEFGRGTEVPITWVDVARRLSALEPAQELWVSRPKTLASARVDWTGLTLVVGPRTSREDVVGWLERVFPSRIEGAGGLHIVLDGPPSAQKLLIEFEESDEDEAWVRPNLGSVEGEIDFRARSEPSKNRSMPFIACHSVKGGTGRTTTAIAIATVLGKRQGKPTLVVDADLEAPGLSYLYRESRPEFYVSLEDVVALAHSEGAADFQQTVNWAASRLSAHRFGDVIILPLRRALDELASSAIRAEHLATGEHPYAFADLLEAIAAAADCGAVVVDVRAGLVPLSAQLILDPSVSRVVVTSLAGQSLEATVALMKFTAREQRRAGVVPSAPLLVVNRIPGVLRDLGQDEALLAPALDRIVESMLADRTSEAGANEAVLDDALALNPLFVSKLGEVADLQVPSRRWEGFSEQLETSGFLKRMEPQLLAWLDTQPTDGAREVPAAVEEPTAAPAALRSRDERRKALSDFARRLVSAETADSPVETPLVTGPMKALVLENAQAPIVIVEGAKGTGKTLTARYLLSLERWSRVTSAMGAPEPTFDADILPVLGSIQTSERFRNEIDTARSRIAERLNVGSPQAIANTREYLRDKLNEQLTERQWSDVWLNVIAWSAGVSTGSASAGVDFLRLLRGRDEHIICAVEGIEELYESTLNPNLPAMLRSILIDVPLRLRSEPGRPLGLIVFARRDSVNTAVTQNRNQFRAQYTDYALTWTEDDVLELAAWIATQSNSLNIWDREFRALPNAEKERLLIALWGRKLGPEEQPGQRRVQEAYTAGWVIAALSDLQGRLVARDLVRFLQYAAEATSQADDRGTYGARLLYPSALKAAIGPTSRDKVAETEEEISELSLVFAKFRAKSNSVKAPIDGEAASEIGLDSQDLDLLRLHGIILGDAPPYEVPELFRMGLGLRHAGARHSVLGTKRRARQRLAAQS